MPFTLTGLCEFREEIRKSRFITLATPITSPQDAQAFFEQHSDLNATHNCWAWKLGDQYRSSDDGEPGGTAGRPILAAIEAQGFDQVAVLVIRWYGGIQLGTGGLARAVEDEHQLDIGSKPKLAAAALAQRTDRQPGWAIRLTEQRRASTPSTGDISFLSTAEAPNKWFLYPRHFTPHSRSLPGTDLEWCCRCPSSYP